MIDIYVIETMNRENNIFLEGIYLSSYPVKWF
jgi:hypothetical protein